MAVMEIMAVMAVIKIGIQSSETAVKEANLLYPTLRKRLRHTDRLS